MSYFQKLIKFFTGNNKQDARQPVSQVQADAGITVEEEIKLALERLAPHRRDAFLPVTEAVDSQYSKHDKIGGLPYLRNTEDWPVCPNCQKHMQLFVQLNMAQLPAQQQRGLFQLFYCTTGSADEICEVKQEGFWPFSANTVARIIDHNGPSGQIVPNREDVFDEKRIVSWTRIDDYPHYENYEELGIELSLSEDAEILMDEQQIGVANQGDKLFGWPYWVQSSEYPFDRKSGTQMELLFQLGWEDNLPYMFGDAGVGHVTQSPDNINELAFGWACS